MSNRRRLAGSRRRLAGYDDAAVVRELRDRTAVCAVGGCIDPPGRWYVRSDLDDQRVVVVAACPAHYARADQEVCGNRACLAPEDEHFVRSHNECAVVVQGAIEGGWGVGLPWPRDWARLDVVRKLPAYR